MNVRDARAAALFVRCDLKDDEGRMLRAAVPGHEARFYCVEFDRQSATEKTYGVIGCRCTNVDDGEPCKGNTFNICFHTIAALVWAARKANLRLSFCKDLEKAKKIGGRIVTLASRQSSKVGWIVYRPRGTGKKSKKSKD